jgi:hypothetical protein
MNHLWLILAALVGANPGPVPAVETPGLDYAPPEFVTAAGAPVIFADTHEAGPDQSFLLVGEGLDAGVELTAWGVHPDAAGGREIKPKVQTSANGVLIATLPERIYEGPVVVWAKNAAGYSEPIVLNAPQPWWCQPDVAAPGDVVRVFGRSLAQPPGRVRAFVYLARTPKTGQAPGVHDPEPVPFSERIGEWLRVVQADKYQVHVALPEDLEPGEYQLWFHAGNGGKFGWGEPVSLQVAAPPADSPAGTVSFSEGNLQQAVDRLAAAGGGTVQVAAGEFLLTGTLVVPAGVQVTGAGRDQTVLVSPADPTVRLVPVAGSAWNQGPSAVHSVGDEMAYRVTFPADGAWTVWLRYATEMSPYNLPGVSKHMTLAVAGGEPVPLDNLPNTGSFGTFRWSRSATIEVTAGTHEVVWKNVKGGGIHIDAFVFAKSPEYTPGENPLPVTDGATIVIQGEDLVRFQTKEGSLPGGDRAAVWLAGHGAGISNLTICGSPRVNLGIAIRHPEYPKWIENCRVVEVNVRGCEGKQAENCGIRLYHADNAVVKNNELWGRAPLFLSGVKRSQFVGNRLVSQTLWGGNSEGYILGRNDTVRQCIIEDNVCASPPGQEAGGPTGRRMVWLSTGRGSVDWNWIANNREDRARFGGVAGTDQNVGEMILFEACQRIAFYGPLAAADAQSVTLPATLPPTPDDRLGSVKREQLAYDEDGNETPFWPPDVDQGTAEPTADEYFVTVLRGRGWGQTRRVVARQGETYHLDRPWRVAPEPGCLALVHTAYWRNHIVGNRTVDGMTGVQLWISCIENIVSGNDIQRMRKPGLYLYGNCSTLASSMPTTWNRGIGPLYFNHIEGTRCDEISCGALVTSGEMHQLPVEFPRCLGNVLRHNSFVRSRTDGVLITGNRPADEQQPSVAILGTIAEFNVVRDASVGYRVARSAEATLLRRNHAYFWYPVNQQPGPRVAFQVDNEKAAVALELNSVEGIHGGADQQIVPEQRGPATPAK